MTDDGCHQTRAAKSLALMPVQPRTRSGGYYARRVDVKEATMARLPDATEQVRLAPVRVLRAIFSGVGQLLLAADRFRAEEADQQQARTAEQDLAGPLDDEPNPPVMLKITSSVQPAPKAVAGKSVRSATTRSTGKSRKAGNTIGKATKTGSSGASRASKAAAKAKEKPAQEKPAQGKPAQGKPARAAKSAQDKPARAAKPAKGGARAAEKPGGASRSAQQPARFRSLDSTGNVRVLTEQDIADRAQDELDRTGLARTGLARTGLARTGLARSPADPAAPEPMPGDPALTVPAPPESALTGPVFPSPLPPVQASPEPESPGLLSPEPLSPEAVSPESEPLATELPIRGYDDLSLASLRARLRHLDAAQLELLVAHERSHANRTDVLTMFGNRIAKLGSATTSW